MVECDLAKVEVAGSNPVSRSIFLHLTIQLCFQQGLYLRPLFRNDRKIDRVADATVVTEIYDCSRAPEEERAGMDNGRAWIEDMTKTLERLDAVCARDRGDD